MTCHSRLTYTYRSPAAMPASPFAADPESTMSKYSLEADHAPSSATVQTQHTLSAWISVIKNAKGVVNATPFHDLPQEADPAP